VNGTPISTTRKRQLMHSGGKLSSLLGKMLQQEKDKPKTLVRGIGREKSIEHALSVREASAGQVTPLSKKTREPSHARGGFRGSLTSARS